MQSLGEIEIRAPAVGAKIGVFLYARKGGSGRVRGEAGGVSLPKLETLKPPMDKSVQNVCLLLYLMCEGLRFGVLVVVLMLLLTR